MRAGEEADDAGGHAHDERRHRLHEAGGRRDADQSGDGARAAPSTLGLPRVIHSMPAQASAAGRGGEVRGGEGAGGEAVGRQLRCRR